MEGVEGMCRVQMADFGCVRFRDWHAKLFVEWLASRKRSRGFRGQSLGFRFQGLKEFMGLGRV